MGGGLMQLVAYGAQDVYLSGNPQITFFKVVYRRHTNFSVEPIQQTWNGAADFGRTVTCNINRNGDAISNMYLAVKLAEVTEANMTVPWGYCSRVGHAMVEETKVEIGGSKIDEQYGDWLNIWYELTHVVGQERGYAKMVGDVPNLTEVSTATKRAYQLYVPLQYWFNRNNGLALPLIALQYHDVRITVKFRDWLQCVNWTTTQPSLTSSAMADSYLLIDYIYLDSEERKRFAQASHEYLIEQLQFTGSESLTSATNKYRLNFNHPSKYLIWAPHLERYASRNNWIAYAFDGDWAAAKERFAKLIAVASGTVTYTPSTTLVAGTIKVNVGVVTPTIGDLVEVVYNPLSGISVDLFNKVEVKMVAQTAATACQIATNGVNGTDEALLTDLLNNCIVTRNDLTMEDLSTPLNDLAFGALAGSQSVLELASLSVVNLHNYGNFLDGSDNPVCNAKLQLNGQDRFQARDGNYFNYVQPAQSFPNTPADGINVYSFALKAVDHQPTGSCNFSRIDNATLQVDCGLYNSTLSGYAPKYLGTGSNTILNIYTVNYNVLRVMSGMAGTAYSN